MHALLTVLGIAMIRHIIMDWPENETQGEI